MKHEIQRTFIKFDPNVLLENYLNKKLWEKKWNVFTYREYVFYLKLNAIWTYDRSLSIHVYGENTKTNETKTGSFYIYIDNDNNKTLIMRRLISAIKNVISHFEDDEIIKSEHYKEAKRQQEYYRKTLEELANNFLDEKEISVEKIRKYYIDGFLKEHWKTFTSKIMKNMKYNLMTDLYCAWLIYADDKEKLNYFLDYEAIGYNPENVENEIKDFKEYLENENLLVEMEATFNEIKK